MRKVFPDLLVSSIIFILVSSAQIKQQKSGTRVVFYVEHEVEQPNDYVQLSIEIKSQQPSLDQAITQAKQIVQKVQTIVKNYCKQHSKGKNDCEGVVETSKYEINPIYQLVRKVPTFVVFQAFSVKHETIAKIKDVRNIGKLADDILKSKVSKINSFKWKPLKQIDIEEQTISEGMEIVNSICDRIGGMKLDRIIQVSEVSDYQQDDKQQEQSKQQQKESKQEQIEQEENKVVYKFSIICGEKKKRKKENN